MHYSAADEWHFEDQCPDLDRDRLEPLAIYCNQDKGRTVRCEILAVDLSRRWSRKTPEPACSEAISSTVRVILSVVRSR